jgi:hypothetical protein
MRGKPVDAGDVEDGAAWDISISRKQVIFGVPVHAEQIVGPSLPEL